MTARSFLHEAVRAALAAQPGLRTRALRGLLPPSLRPFTSRVLKELRDMAAAGELWRVTTARDEVFFAADPIETLDRLVPPLVSRPMSDRELRRLVERHAPGHGSIALAWKRSAVQRGILIYASPEQRVLRALHDISASEPAGTLIHIARVRRLAGLAKDVFDQAAIHLAQERTIVLHDHDHPRALSAEKREDLVHHQGRYFVGIAASDRLGGRS